jgi:hypothetical protein
MVSTGKTVQTLGSSFLQLPQVHDVQGRLAVVSPVVKEQRRGRVVVVRDRCRG